MSVHERLKGDKVIAYTVRWREGSSNKSRDFDSKRAANSFDKELRRLRQQGELADELSRRRVLVSDLYADWIARQAPGLASKTRETYATQLDLRVLPEFGDRRVAQITVGDVERWITDMRATGAGDPTIIKACTVLQALLSMAMRDGIVTHNVAQQARKPAQSRTRIPHLVKPVAVETIRHQFAAGQRPRDVVLLELLAYAGLRPESEAIRLQWRNVRERSIIVRDTKRNRERTVVMLDTLRETLAEWRLRCGRPDPDALVIPNNAGNAWSDNDWRIWHRRFFKPTAIATGLPADIRSRDLRGSFVSLLVHEGRSIVEVARQVGHSPQICLSMYAQVFSDMDPAQRTPADDVIRAARAEVVDSMFASRSHDTPSKEAPGA